MNKGISRRDFIVGGGVFGASMAAVGLAGCAPSNGGLPSTGTDASGTSTHKGADRPLSSRLVEVDEGDVARTEECDVVVCGSGSAGTYAAIRAAELGARVIWLEKTSLKGGTSTITEGTLAYNTQEQLDAQGPTDLQAEFEAYMQWHNWGAYAPGIWCYLDNSGEALDWAISHGASMSTGGQGSLLSCFEEEGNWTNNGEGMLKPLWAYGETLDNLDFRLESPAVNIILNDEGVGGVYAKCGDDLVRINAKATVLATGGFGKNPEMCAERLRVPSERVVFLGFDGQDGDGINMALTAGALPQAPSAVMYGLSKACGESWSSMLSIFTQWPPAYRYPLEIGKTLPMVNQSGKRFYNETLAEDADTARLNTAIASQSKVFTLFDEAHVEAYEGEDKLNEFVAFMGVGSGELRSLVEGSDFVWKADSFEELAELMGVDSEALAATMEDYNNRAKGDGSHDPLGADPALMTPLEKKPFYAVQVEACAYSTCGGVRGDSEARAIGHDDLPIKGLFVCGTDNGSMQFNDYPYGLHGGSGQGAACTTGYVAANAACKDLGLA